MFLGHPSWQPLKNITEVLPFPPPLSRTVSATWFEENFSKTQRAAGVIRMCALTRTLGVSVKCWGNSSCQKTPDAIFPESLRAILPKRFWSLLLPCSFFRWGNRLFRDNIVLKSNKQNSWSSQHTQSCQGINLRDFDWETWPWSTKSVNHFC